jgi:hypothetical protein
MPACRARLSMAVVRGTSWNWMRGMVAPGAGAAAAGAVSAGLEAAGSFWASARVQAPKPDEGHDGEFRFHLIYFVCSLSVELLRVVLVQLLNIRNISAELMPCENRDGFTLFFGVFPGQKKILSTWWTRLDVLVGRLPLMAASPLFGAQPKFPPLGTNLEQHGAE